MSYEMERLTFDGAAALSPAISSDGNLIAYASDRLFVLLNEVKGDTWSINLER